MMSIPTRAKREITKLHDEIAIVRFMARGQVVMAQVGDAVAHVIVGLA